MDIYFQSLLVKQPLFYLSLASYLFLALFNLFVDALHLSASFNVKLFSFSHFRNLQMYFCAFVSECKEVPFYIYLFL